MGIAQKMADARRAEAKQMLYSAIGLPENTSSEAIDRAVDCIITTAILEATLAINEYCRSDIRY